MKVKFAPGAVDALRAIRKKNEVEAEVATLTDDQLERAAFKVDPKRDGALTMVCVFLRELAKRDERRAFAAFKKWRENAEV